MSASIALGAPRPLVARFERGLLGVRLTLAMFAAGLLVLSVLWQVAFPDQRTLSDLVAGVAALLVAVPVMGAAWDSLRHPSLHGVTDRLIAVALVAAWASGDLMTAAVLPIIMILGHVLEERSLLGSREAIQALTRLTETTARRIEPGGIAIVPAGSLRLGNRLELLPGSRVPADGIVRAGEAGLDMASLTGESVPVDVGLVMLRWPGRSIPTADSSSRLRGWGPRRRWARSSLSCAPPSAPSRLSRDCWNAMPGIISPSC